jgi:hypothetical protein
VFTPSQDEIATARRDNERWESAIGDEPKGTRDKGLAEKGKEWLFGAKGPKCVGQEWDNARRGADSEARGKDMLIPVRHYSLLFRSGQR